MHTPIMSRSNAIIAWYDAIPRCPELRTVTTPIPEAAAFSIAISIAFGVTMMPSPPSESTFAVDGVSRRIRQFGAGLIAPLAYPLTYDRSMFDTPCVSTPRRSADTSTSAASPQSSPGTPIFRNTAATVRRRPSSPTRTSSPPLTLNISSNSALLNKENPPSLRP